VLGEYEGKVKKNLPDLTKRQENGRAVKYEDGILLPKYRLPTEAEWEYAAVGPIANDVTGSQPDRGVYPWKGNRLKVVEGEQRGRPLANFQKGRGDIMGVAGNSDNSAPLPKPVSSYWPNDFGLYCMAGNVNEWVLDVYRPLSFEDVEDKRPFRGNIYTSIVKNEDGHAVKDHLGRITRDTVGTVDRLNYALGDERNYHDGDMYSAINPNMEAKEEQANSNKMYYQGKGAKHESMTSFIDERSRVYKGGSFIDRSYYLSPGTRRFLDERLSREDLGFRCAMDRLGSAEFKATAQAKK
jgi:gliding motility-associated lipoprotein GldJ